MTIGLTYRTARSRAWRNMMVAAINAGLEQERFGFNPGDNRWSNGNVDTQTSWYDPGLVYHFQFPGSIPAAAYVGDAGFDELSIHVALWPKLDGVDRVRSSNAMLSAGDAFASGWLERRAGLWLQTGTRPLFTCRRHLLAQITAPQINALGYADRGKLIM